jgi:hypothetical protein
MPSLRSCRIEPAALRSRFPWAQLHLLRLPRDHPDHAAPPVTPAHAAARSGLLLALDFNHMISFAGWA